MESLYDKLVLYSRKDYYPMHMPGHKRNSNMLDMVNPYTIDITEIEGFDNLHDANGILKKAMERAARIYQSEETHFLINGSTVGLLVGIAACTKKGDKILIARNCHKAVYNAIFLNELQPVYIYPQIDEEYGVNGGISPKKLKELLISNRDIKLVVITSPTYEGFVSDIKGISDVVHEFGIPLIVDEAHGSHFGFHKDFPTTSIINKADIVIHSVHKTLPSFTQTALIHVNGNLVNKDAINKYLEIYQTSSPSYLLMASIDQCMELLESKSNELFDIYSKNLNNFREKLSRLKFIKLIDSHMIGKSDIFDYDAAKLVISVKETTMTGKELYDILLKQYKIQMELVSKDYVLGMTSICDTEEGFHRLLEALLEIDCNIGKTMISRDKKLISSHENEFKKNNNIFNNIALEVELSSYEVYNRESEIVPFYKSEGRISCEYAYLYPPGIPIIVPGEKLNKEIIDKLQELKQSGLEIKGLQDNHLEYIKVIK